MGLLRWLRGGDENNAAAGIMSAGMAEIDGLFRPSKHKQTEHIEESKRHRINVSNGQGIDLDRGVAVLRSKTKTEPAADVAVGVDAPVGAEAPAVVVDPVAVDEPAAAEDSAG
jgi:hypothetical protein